METGLYILISLLIIIAFLGILNLIFYIIMSRFRAKPKANI